MSVEFRDIPKNNDPMQNTIPKANGGNQIDDQGCRTCASRRYQDGSTDAGVSFKAPTHISPEQSFSQVAAHEGEHVVREQSNAIAQGREVVSQSVIIHSSVCPECGKVYSSGGVTNTVTREKTEEQEKSIEPFKGNNINTYV